jgi:methionyl-tRNA formyltransferase
MRIAYFGGDMFYDCMELLTQSGHEIIALFTGTPGKNEYDPTQYVCRQAGALHIPIIRSKPTNEDIKELQRKGCDMILGAGYSYKIPWHESGIQYGINIHPSLLPEGAGPMPLPIVIIKGLKKTGLTLHKISPDWDAGAIVLQESFPLFGYENIEHLLHESQKLAVKLLKHFIESPEKYWNNSIPQVRKEGDYWPMPKPDAFLINYNQDVGIVEKYLRVHRFTDNQGNLEFISGVSFWQQSHNFEPGTTLSEKDGVHLVAAKDGLVCFKLEKKPSKNKRD